MANRGQPQSSPAAPRADVNGLTNAFVQAGINPASAPTTPAGRPRPGQGGMSARRARPGLNLADIDPSLKAGPPPGIGAGGGALGAGLGAGRPQLGPEPAKKPGMGGTPFSNFSKIVDPSGVLRFGGGKAVLHSSGVDFSNGSSFKINMSEFRLDEELGRGNYGTVKKVYHKPTNVVMAMKEIRLELDDAKLNAILMELDILHRAIAPEIVDFYGAFFIESCVYYCMEYMDAGSLDNLNGEGVPEDVLARITTSMVRGLKFLKDELQIMHRDVKPTNMLVNRKGAVKLCDFGVSGQLERSLAKTNIGCQSYMAPERIKGESLNNLGTYTVSSDVWSLGLSIIELALGAYPYPPETYSNVFAQLTAIVHGPPPELPAGKYSADAESFVASCLIKEPTKRATYAELLEHPWLVADSQREVDMPAWVAGAIAYRDAKRAAGTKVSSSDDKVPDRATVDAAVEAGKVVPAPEGEKPAVDGEKLVVDGAKEPVANGEVKIEDMIGKPLADGVECGKPESVAEEAKTPPADGIESIAEETEPKPEA
ncbi:kinase-like protein [Ceratobasidium sp. AG-I]|nr:kinase-like protein [Ceratobasidium sp. AG-I]